MTLQLFGHPFSSYTWKATIALDEKGVDYDFRMIGPGEEANAAELAERSPMGKFPLLTDGDRAIFEASAIIEYLDVCHPEPRLIPDDVFGVEVRMRDRLFDNYVMGAMQRIVDHRLDISDAGEADKGRAVLDKSYAWLETNLGLGWAVGESFTLADCAAAPALFYADWVHPIPDEMPTLKAYRARLLERENVARAVDGARPYRHLFPGGAPERD